MDKERGIQVENPISEQIIENMIGRLKNLEDFPESILTKLKSTDLTNRTDVKDILSNLINMEENEDTETGD